MKSKNKIIYRLQHNLIYRLIISMLIFVLPVCSVAVTLATISVQNASNQILRNYQEQISKSMLELEADIGLVDVNMEQFVYEYIAELNVSNSELGETVIYEMFTSLQEIMGKSGQVGIVAIYQKDTGKVLLKEQNFDVSLKTMEVIKNVMRKNLVDEKILKDYSFLQYDTQYFFIHYFEYYNYKAVFLFDIGHTIAEKLGGYLEEGGKIYYYNSGKTYQINIDGSAERITMTWEKCVQSSSKAILWESDSLPISVCVDTGMNAWNIVPISYWIWLVVALLSVCMIAFFWKLLKIEVLNPIHCLTDAMKELQKDNMHYRINNNEIRNSEEIQYLYDNFDKMAYEIQLSGEKDKQMYQAQMDNLRLQVNPHMLLNSINTIYSLAQTGEFERIQDYSLLLVDYFRYSLRANEDMVSLRQELEFVKNYINIQKIRYPNSFSSVYDVEEICMEAKIPPLLIQNFIENAIKYAFKPGAIVEVLLNIYKQDDRIKISIIDTGRGIKPEILDKIKSGEPYVDRMGHKHIGIWNCVRRIKLYFKENPEIIITSTFGEGTQVFVNIPFIRDN